MRLIRDIGDMFGLPGPRREGRTGKTTPDAGTANTVPEARPATHAERVASRSQVDLESLRENVVREVVGAYEALQAVCQNAAALEKPLGLPEEQQSFDKVVAQQSQYVADLIKSIARGRKTALNHEAEGMDTLEAQVGKVLRGYDNQLIDERLYTTVGVFAESVRERTETLHEKLLLAGKLGEYTWLPVSEPLARADAAIIRAEACSYAIAEHKAQGR